MRRAALVILLIGMATVAPGCAERVAEWKIEAQQLTDETNELRNEYHALRAEYDAMIEAGEGDTEQAEEIRDQLVKWEGEIDQGVAAINALNEKIQGAHDGWDIAELIIGGIAGAVPAVGVLIPPLRLAKRRFRLAVEAVSDGGGPRDPVAAARRLRDEPGAKKAIRKIRLAVGDSRDLTEGPIPDTGPIT